MLGTLSTTILPVLSAAVISWDAGTLGFRTLHFGAGRRLEGVDGPVPK